MRYSPRSIASTLLVIFSVPLVALEARAESTSFEFTYIWHSGELLEGTFEGDLQADGDTIFNVKNVVATFKGISIDAPLTRPGRDRASLSGAGIDLSAIDQFRLGDDLTLGVHCGGGTTTPFPTQPWCISQTKVRDGIMADTIEISFSSDPSDEPFDWGTSYGETWESTRWSATVSAAASPVPSLTPTGMVMLFCTLGLAGLRKLH
jgi:hypothetical protein